MYLFIPTDPSALALNTGCPKENWIGEPNLI